VKKSIVVAATVMGLAMLVFILVLVVFLGKVDTVLSNLPKPQTAAQAAALARTQATQRAEEATYVNGLIARLEHDIESSDNAVAIRSVQEAEATLRSIETQLQAICTATRARC
jgi:hypothetical protein